MNNKSFNIILFCIGLLIGFIICDWFKSEPIDRIITKTKIESDTVYVEIRDTLFLTKTEIKQEVIRDTILIEPFKPQIRAFKASRPFLYGNTYVNGEVLGEVLKMDIVNDFTVPTVTNTVTNTTTVIKKPSGFYLMAGVTSSFAPSVGGLMIRDKYVFGYQYGLNQSHSIQVGYKIF